MQKRVFIVGSSGFAGSHLGPYYRRLGLSVIDDSAYLLRTENQAQLQKVLRLTRPDLLIHAARYDTSLGLPGIRSLHENLFQNCAELNIRVLYLSCDQVFGGVSAPYSEDALPGAEAGGDPFLKMSEAVIKSRYSDQVALVRIPLLWSENVRKDRSASNFLARVYDALDGRPIQLETGLHRDLLYWRTMADALLKIDSPGVYHLREENRLSLYDTAVVFARALGAENWLINKHLRPLDADVFTDRYYHLDAQRTEEQLGLKFSGGIRRIRDILAP